MKKDAKIIKYGGFGGEIYFFTAPCPNDISSITWRDKTVQASLIQGGENCFAIVMTSPVFGPQRDEIIRQQVMRVWHRLFEVGTVDSSLMPVPIDGDPRMMLLGKDAELRLASDRTVWFEDIPIGQVPVGGIALS